MRELEAKAPLQPRPSPEQSSRRALQLLNHLPQIAVTRLLSLPELNWPDQVLINILADEVTPTDAKDYAGFLACDKEFHSLRPIGVVVIARSRRFPITVT